MKKDFTAERMRQLGAESAFEVLARAKELEKTGVEVVHFEIGEPDFDTPEHIKEAAVKALKEGYTHYTPSPGILELRAAIAEKVSNELGIGVDPVSEVVVMPGGKPCIFTAIYSMVNPGDEVLIPNPSYPAYESVVNFAGGISVPMPLKEENDFRLIPEDIERLVTKKTKMIVLNSPHNPCGSLLTKRDVEGIAEIVKKHNLLVLSDEIYDKITYGQKHYSIASEPDMKDRTIILNGFSKTYAMTGWRLGYAIASKSIISQMAKLHLNISSCAAAFVQMAGVTALKGSQDCVKEMLQQYARRREAIVEGLNRIQGISCKKPGGAFYVFPNIKKLGIGSRELAQYLLTKGGVAALHGTAFGKFGEGYLRFSYATSITNIKKGLEKIKTALEKLKTQPILTS